MTEQEILALENELVTKLAELVQASRHDPESSHIVADRLLCEALNKLLPSNDASRTFRDIKKWYV